MHRLIHWAKDAIQLRSVTHSLRSPQWHHVEKAFIELNGYCAACGAKDSLQVHHKKPFHLFPELELDTKNLITLCEKSSRGNHHLNVGHNGDWQNYNPNVEQDASALRRSALDKRS